MKSLLCFCSAVAVWSLPVRGAWIEINLRKALMADYSVAPRAGSVD